MTCGGDISVSGFGLASGEPSSFGTQASIFGTATIDGEGSFDVPDRRDRPRRARHQRHLPDPALERLRLGRADPHRRERPDPLVASPEGPWRRALYLLQLRADCGAHDVDRRGHARSRARTTPRPARRERRARRRARTRRREQRRHAPSRLLRRGRRGRSRSDPAAARRGARPSPASPGRRARRRPSAAATRPCARRPAPPRHAPRARRSTRSRRRRRR